MSDDSIALSVAGNAHFKDFFSRTADAYARFRPRYPDALFAHLASATVSRDLAWDCATGSGQAAVALARHFTRVIATDASAAQLRHAEHNPRVSYRVATAESSGLDDGSIDLVTVAQALHWFDLADFYAEVRRVLVPSGVLAAWCYSRVSVTPTVDRVLDRYYETCDPFWPPERRLVESGYRDIAFPFQELSAPAFHVEEWLTLDQLAGYLRTWSATQRLAERLGTDPVMQVREEMRTAWGDDALPRRVTWPLHVRIGTMASGPRRG